MVATTLSLEPVSFSSSVNNDIAFSFRVASELPPREKPLDVATSLQFEFMNSEHEVFAERLTARDVVINEDGLRHVQLSGAHVPRFQNSVNDTTVILHAWKGQKWLGKWELGTL
ncbi:hypothetical protein JX265_008511 [Neoarthrinium moseri]|uniref:Uncharacterized protein n=1 Tax=Neoarthrinium moseri TaxID=1658444 RepID=A0A9P9WIG9_9PEZI|nr:uncharacterized protein JN550_001516 [Neoarthrinium moseri]KAI1843659.1 hypothetical protein JX266_010105 [Neoarthrinium moseri]KAI1864787.1 hypothetical protein JX265_008511 [Neoarthrinium moseri]KAI1876020.1 hypothetical protein JN550_001516 [Neoarthrinium moseri]